MDKMIVKDLMIPLEEYATVASEATLKEAMMELKKAQAEFAINNQSSYKHRALLVYDNRHGQIIGKLSQLDVLKALEPKYSGITDTGTLGRIATSGLNLRFLQSMLEKEALFTQSFSSLCKRAAAMKVKDCMYIPVEGEFIRENDSMRMATHQLVMGNHHSLLVINDQRKINGILRLVDVFQTICDKINAL
ncbi:MAG: CBS domain-containing protein [Desulfosudaceae bacterium]